MPYLYNVCVCACYPMFNTATIYLIMKKGCRLKHIVIPHPILRVI